MLRQPHGAQLSNADARSSTVYDCWPLIRFWSTRTADPTVFFHASLPIAEVGKRETEIAVTTTQV